MSKYCPIIKEKVLYTECLECEAKLCRNDYKETSSATQDNEETKGGTLQELKDI